MPSLDKSVLLAGVSPPLDRRLAEQMFDEFISLERRYVLREWEPATLDGGQFAEVTSRLIYHQDSSNLNRRKSVHDCLSYIEYSNNSNPHHFPERKASLHLAKVIRTIYKFRSDRGAVHIDPDYTANHLYSKLVLENSRWVLSEILRIFWTADRSLVAKAIRQIVQYDVPCIGVFEGKPLVQRTDCTPEEEVLILLHHAGEQGLSRNDLGRFVMKSPSTITHAIDRLVSPRLRQIVKLANGNYRLTDPGVRRVIMELADKLVI
jgi:hypothetical protein